MKHKDAAHKLYNVTPRRATSDKVRRTAQHVDKKREQKKRGFPGMF